MIYPQVPFFRNGQILEESSLYKLARLSVESARWTIVATGFYGFFRPPFLTSEEVNRINISNNKIKIENLFVTSKRGYPFIIKEKEIDIPQGDMPEDLYLYWVLPSNSDEYGTAFDQNTMLPEIKSSFQQLQDSDNIISLHLCNFRNGEIGLILPPITVDSQITVLREFERLKETIRSFKIKLAEYKVSELPDKSELLMLADLYDLLLPYQPADEIICKTREFVRGAMRYFQTLYYELYLKKQWTEFEGFKEKSLEISIDKKWKQKFGQIGKNISFEDYLREIRNTLDYKKLDTTKGIEDFFKKISEIFEINGRLKEILKDIEIHPNNILLPLKKKDRGVYWKYEYDCGCSSRILLISKSSNRPEVLIKLSPDDKDYKAISDAFTLKKRLL